MIIKKNENNLKKHLTGIFNRGKISHG